MSMDEYTLYVLDSQDLDLSNVGVILQAQPNTASFGLVAVAHRV
jgi:hypothetical protein